MPRRANRGPRSASGNASPKSTTSTPSDHQRSSNRAANAGVGQMNSVGSRTTAYGTAASNAAAPSHDGARTDTRPGGAPSRAPPGFAGSPHARRVIVRHEQGPGQDPRRCHGWDDALRGAWRPRRTSSGSTWTPWNTGRGFRRPVGRPFADRPWPRRTRMARRPGDRRRGDARSRHVAPVAPAHPDRRIRADIWITRSRTGYVVLQANDQPEPVIDILSPYVLVPSSISRM